MRGSEGLYLLLLGLTTVAALRPAEGGFGTLPNTSPPLELVDSSNPQRPPSALPHQATADVTTSSFAQWLWAIPAFWVGFQLTKRYDNFKYSRQTPDERRALVERAARDLAARDPNIPYEVALCFYVRYLG
jgi:hypothetical protein